MPVHGSPVHGSPARLSRIIENAEPRTAHDIRVFEVDQGLGGRLVRDLAGLPLGNRSGSGTGGDLVHSAML
ncbi:MAG: hypothetical protein ACYTF9_07370 [Planctomycetota bacterium]